MNCPNCHKPIPARARYCIHCGAEQEPTPIAAVAAAAMSARGRREAANAAHAEAMPDVQAQPITRAAIVELPSAARARDPHESSDPVTRPAYADAPSRHALAVGLVVACLVVGIVAGATAWWFHAPSVAGTDAAAKRAEPVAAAPSAGAVTPAVPPPSAATATDSAPVVASPENSLPEAATPTAAEAKGDVAIAPQPVEITPLPPAHTASRAARAPPRQPEPPKTAARSSPVPATSSPPAEAVAPHAPAVAMAPPAAPAVSDRWARMDVELSHCTREDFIARVVCGQRVRFRYCDGYWGKVPACPGSPAVEHGQ